MSESIAKRVSRLVAGGFNSMVDAVENAAPETVMEQAIRELDDSIDQIRAELGQVIANKHLASNRLMEENRRHDEIGAKIQLAVDEMRDDLAEVAIAQQMDIEAQIPILERTISDAGERERELEGYIRALQGKKREMEVELSDYKATRLMDSGPSDESTGVAISSADGKAQKAVSAFDRAMRSATGVSGPGDVSDRKSAAQLAELDELARRNRIKERLAEIKASRS